MRKQWRYSIVMIAMMSGRLCAQSIATVINTPGIYVFGDLTGLDPDIINDTAISIQSDDVIIDFQGHRLSQDPANQVDGFSGIRIESGFSHIILKNIKIIGMTGQGVLISQGCSDITLNDITMQACDAAGLLANGTSGSPVQDLNVNNCFVISCTGADGNPAYGIRLLQTNDLQIDNASLFYNDAGTTASGFGISLEFCTAGEVTNCLLNGNGGNAVAAGINLLNTTLITIDNCEIANTIARASGSGNKAVGVLLNTCSTNVVSNSIAKNNNNLLAAGFGFEAGNGSGNIFENCIAQGNTGGTLSAGFTLRNNETHSAITNCKSRDNSGGSSGEGTGIRLDTAQVCDVWYNVLTNNTGATGHGLEDTVTETTNLIAGNVTFQNTTQGFSVTRTAGTFPLLTAQVGSFTAIANASQYYNIDFSVGP